MASKPIYERFPERTRRVRLGRGYSAEVMVKSEPTIRDLFEAVATKLVFYKEMLVEQDMRLCGLQSTYVDAFYHDNDPSHQRFGYIHYGVCNCSQCNSMGLSTCQTGKELNQIVLAVERYVHWYDNQELFLANLCRHTSNMEVISPIVEYFYPYETDKNSAMLLQVRLIEQYKEIKRERAEARARATPPPIAFTYNEMFARRRGTEATPGAAAQPEQFTIVDPVTPVPGQFAVVDPVTPVQEVIPTPVEPDGRTFAQRLADAFGRETQGRTEQRLTNFREAIQQLQLEEDRRIFDTLMQAADRILVNPTTNVTDEQNIIAANEDEDVE